MTAGLALTGLTTLKCTRSPSSKSQIPNPSTDWMLTNLQPRRSPKAASSTSRSRAASTRTGTRGAPSRSWSLRRRATRSRGRARARSRTPRSRSRMPGPASWCTTATPMASGRPRRGSWCIWISNRRFGRRVTIRWSIRSRLVNKLGGSGEGEREMGGGFVICNERIMHSGVFKNYRAHMNMKLKTCFGYVLWMFLSTYTCKSIASIASIPDMTPTQLALSPLTPLHSSSSATTNSVARTSDGRALRKVLRNNCSLLQLRCGR